MYQFSLFAHYARIEPKAESNDSGFIEMTFDIDGVQSGNFSHSPKGTGNDYNFNNVVFASEQLSLQNHSLTIHNGFVGGPTSLVILDSIAYTYACVRLSWVQLPVTYDIVRRTLPLRRKPL
jgi:hypothetical protein